MRDRKRFSPKCDDKSTNDKSHREIINDYLLTASGACQGLPERSQPKVVQVAVVVAEGERQGLPERSQSKVVVRSSLLLPVVPAKRLPDRSQPKVVA